MSETNTNIEQSQEGTAKAETKAKAAAQKAAEEAIDKAHQDKLRDLEIEAKKLELLERQANLEDIQERLAERQMKRDAIRQKAYTNGATLRDTAQREGMVQKRCNHRKGGNGAAGIKLGQGVSPHYAVIKHTMLNGDMWVRCQRCGKTWKPPIKADFTDIDEYIKAATEYETARNFPSNNTPSSSQLFQWSDGGAYAREVLRHSTLR